MNRIDTAIFFEMLRKSNRKAYSQLCDAYFDRLLAFAANMVFREDIAKDIVQDVFVKLYEKSPQFNNSFALQSYLFTSVRNRCYNYLRDLKVEDKHNMLYVQAIFSSENEDVLDDDFFAQIDVGSVLQEVNLIVENLPNRCREVCRMRFIEKRKYAEIATLLHISESNVKVQISRGMEKIRVEMKKYNFSLILFIINVLK